MRATVKVAPTNMLDIPAFVGATFYGRPHVCTDYLQKVI